MNEVNTLLMEIKNAIGCQYLSDLHASLRLHNKQAEKLILAIPLERYPLQDWNDAILYITGKKCNFQSVEEAREKIALLT